MNQPKLATNNFVFTTYSDANNVTCLQINIYMSNKAIYLLGAGKSDSWAVVDIVDNGLLLT